MYQLLLRQLSVGHLLSLVERRVHSPGILLLLTDESLPIQCRSQTDSGLLLSVHVDDTTVTVAVPS